MWTGTIEKELVNTSFNYKPELLGPKHDNDDGGDHLKPVMAPSDISHVEAHVEIRTNLDWLKPKWSKLP